MLFVNSSNTLQPTWTSVAATGSTSTRYAATSANTYYFWVKDGAGNVNKQSFVIPSSAFSYPATATVINDTCEREETCYHKWNTYDDHSANCYNGYLEQYSCGARGEETCWYVGCSGCVHYQPNGTRKVTYECQKTVYSCPSGGNLNVSTLMCEM